MTHDDRRAFLGYCAFAGLTSTLFPSAVLAQIRPGTATIDVATIRGAARLAGLAWTEAECRDVADSLSSLTASIERIGKDDPDSVRLIDLRFFAGLSLPECAEAMQVSLSTVQRWWQLARARLAKELGP